MSEETKTNEVILAMDARKAYRNHIENTKQTYKNFVIDKVNKAVNCGSGRVYIDCRHTESVKDYVIKYLNSYGYDVDVKSGQMCVYWDKD